MPDPVSRALAVAERSAKDVVIPRSQTVEFSQREPQFTGVFHKIDVKSFEDLKTLSVLPKGLDETKARRAITADDQLTRTNAARIVRTEKAASWLPENTNVGNRNAHDIATRRAFEGMRRSTNRNLAKLLSDCHRTTIPADSQIATSAYLTILNVRWIIAHDYLLAFLNDITIEHNATMNIAQGTNSLRGHDLRIHTGGKMVINVSNINIRLNSAEGNIA